MITKRKIFIFASVSAVLSQIFVALAVLPMNMVFWLSSTKTFLLCFSAITAFLVVIGSEVSAATFFFTAANVLVFNILRKKKTTIFVAGLTASLVSFSGVLLLSFGLLKTTGQSLFFHIEQRMTQLIGEMATISPSLSGLDVQVVMTQLPSAFIIYFMICSFLVVATEIRLLTPFAKVKRPVVLSMFKVPDPVIWIFILSLLAAFLKTPYELLTEVGVNAFNVLAVIYFFQGLAIVKRFFEVFNVGPFWRALGYLVFILQVTLFTSAIGVIDYWVNFRARFAKRASQIRHEIKK